MKKGIRTFCNSDGSTSTLNQQNSTIGNIGGDITSSKVSSPFLQCDEHSNSNSKQNTPTLEDLILQLEMEEELARKEKLNEYSGIKGRMSCVNNSDILRSARNALNQYPRFSLDGRDSMYRSSFGTIEERRRSVCSEKNLRGKLVEENDDDDDDKKVLCFPPKVAGERVVWCKPGVVAKLMGLEAIPVPIGRKRCENRDKKSSVVGRRQNLMRRRFEKHDLERKFIGMDMQGNYGDEFVRRRNRSGFCSKNNGYCIVKPVSLEAMAGGPASWQPKRYV